VSWRSKKEAVVSQSTMESEYIVGSDAGNEAIWLRRFVNELGVFPSMHDHVVLLCDNTSAIANTKDPRSHSVAKHIPRRYHVIRQYVHHSVRIFYFRCFAGPELGDVCTCIELWWC
jgi:hypothetical protein